MKILIIIAFSVWFCSCGNEGGGNKPRFVDSNNTKIRDGRTGPIADSAWSGKDNDGDTIAE